MSANLTALLYLASGVLFILALRGLSSPATSRQGNQYGMIGMAIAVATTLLLHVPSFTSLLLIVVGVGIGGGIGATVARRTSDDVDAELVAGFHALVGLAAVLVAGSAFFAPHAFGIGSRGDIEGGSLFEMSLGAGIGAITFTGSIIAFLKLSERMTGKPILLPERHTINILLGVGILACIALFVGSESGIWLFLLIALSLVVGVTLIIPIGGADMPVVVSMLNSYSGWAAAGIGFTLGNLAFIITGALVGSSGAILSYIMCKGDEPLVHLRHSRRIWRRGGGRLRTPRKRARSSRVRPTTRPL